MTDIRKMQRPRHARDARRAAKDTTGAAEHRSPRRPPIGAQARDALWVAAWTALQRRQIRAWARAWR